MTLRFSTLALVLTLALAACGGSAERTQRSTAAPGAEPAAVTATERRVIQRWSEEMTHGRVKAAAKYFSVPSESLNMPPGGADLASARQVEEFNASFPCGTKLLSLARSVHRLVVAEFELTSRPGATCGTSTGQRATFAFLIDSSDHIARFMVVGDQAGPEIEPGSTLAA